MWPSTYENATKSAWNTVFSKLIYLCWKVWVFKKEKVFVFVNLIMCVRISGVFGLYIDVLNASMRFSVVFCIYEHILKDVFASFLFTL